MAEPFKFSSSKIDDHIEKVGVDIRPVIECKLEQTKLFDFGRKLVDKHPNLFESLVQSPADFHIRKKFIFPGKGEADLATLGITPRGLAFIFPRKVGIFEEETELNTVGDMVLGCLKIFRGVFPEKKVFRVGLVNEYIFNTGLLESTRLVSERFTKLLVPPDGEITIVVNRPTDDYNKRIQLEAVRRIEPVPEIPSRAQTKNYGVKVIVDFNNRDMSQDMDEGSILAVLHEAQQYNDKDLYEFLNGSRGEN
jgi:hypothetical protein